MLLCPTLPVLLSFRNKLKLDEAEHKNKILSARLAASAEEKLSIEKAFEHFERDEGITSIEFRSILLFGLVRLNLDSISGRNEDGVSNDACSDEGGLRC